MEIHDIVERYNQPWRYHHTLKHLEELQASANGLNLSALDSEAFRYAAIFHDAVYEPFADNNEDKSNELWLEYALEKELPSELIAKVGDIILSTKTPAICKNNLEITFRNADWHYMGIRHAIDEEYGRWLNEYENNIFKEFQKVPVDEYVGGRMSFLLNSFEANLITKEVLDYLRPLVSRKRKIGIYAGSFLPFHIGHLNILRKAERIFDKVIVAQGENPEKKGISKVRHNNVKGVLRHHEVESYECQLVDYIQSRRSEYCEPVLIRGLRNGYDLNQETNLIRFINEQTNARGIAPIPIVYITCDREFEHISSSAIRMLDDEDALRYIPREIADLEEDKKARKP